MADGSAALDATRVENQAECLLLLFVSLLAGAVSMFPLTHSLILLWRTDPLRSFGVLIPIVSCVLIARNWSDLQWTRQGTWWGMLPLASSIVFNRSTSDLRITLQLHGTQIDPVQPGLVLFAYMSGVLLLLGGSELWTRSIFPLCLLLAVDPIPHVFTRWIDLPLQTASADVARRFAYVIGLHPTGKQLDLLFTPVLGMTIVPGCDGMRGAATMAYGALLIGYLRRFRPLRLVGLTAAAALLGYLLNFARLCILVGYYWIAFHVPALSADGVTVDYIIGGTIFLFVGFMAGALWLGGSGHEVSRVSQDQSPWPAILRQPRVAAASLLLLVAVITAVPQAYALIRQPVGYMDPAEAAKAMPSTAGDWHQVRQFTQDLYGRTAWQWTEYKRADGTTVQVALWLMTTVHHAIDSLNVTGEVPLSQTAFEAYAANSVPVHFTVITMLDHRAGDRPVPTYLAETTCIASQCAETAVRGDQFLSIRSGYQRTLSILMRVQHPAAALDIPPQQQASDRAAVSDLMHFLDTRDLTARLGHPQPKQIIMHRRPRVYTQNSGRATMTKADLVDQITAQGDLTRRDGEVITETFFGGVIDALRTGDKVEIRGFGSFRTRQRNPRTGRNPKTGSKVEVPAKRVPFFKPSKELRDLVNNSNKIDDAALAANED